jgi:hypothetical protein
MARRGMPMSDTLPKIWVSKFIDEPENIRSINYHIGRKRLDYLDEFDRHDAVERSQAPDYIFFKLKDLKPSYRANTPDWVMITDRIFVISEKFHNLLSGMKMGPTRMFEVPLFEYDQKTMRPGRWFILHIVAKKRTVIPELSEGVREYETKGFWGPQLAAVDTLTVQAGAAEGEDLWVDPYYSNRIFLTDRLFSAITSAKIKIRNPAFSECTVVAGYSQQHPSEGAADA